MFAVTEFCGSSFDLMPDMIHTADSSVDLCHDSCSRKNILEVHGDRGYTVRYRSIVQHTV